MVIVFIMVFSIIAGAVLNLASTGFKTTVAIKDIRTKLHAADGAMDGAINAIRGSNKGLASAGACPQFTLPATSSDPQVDVTCSPSGSTGGVFDDQPAWAILTLGKNAGQGIIKTGNFHTEIAGGAFSSKDIESTGGPDCKDVNDQSCNALTVDGDVIALANCDPNSGSPAFDPTRIYVPTGADLTCLRGVTDADREARGADPNYPTMLGYPNDLAALSGDQTIATFNNSVDPAGVCQVSNTLVKFVPGMYTQPLQNLIPTACKTATTWWLSPSDTNCTPSLPGAYYFNFKTSGSTLWDLSATNASVIGGKLTTGCSLVGGKTSAPSVPAIPGACVEDTAGVQLIFGGGTSLKVKGGTFKLDLCGSKPDSSLTNQRIVLYGLPVGSAKSPVSNAVKNATGATSTTFSSPTNALTTNAVSTCSTLTCAHADLHAKLTASGTAAKSASLSLTGFPAIPLGSTITAASIEVTHQESGPRPISVDASWQSVDRFNAAQSPTTQPCSTTQTTLNTSATLHTNSCDILSALSTAPFGPYAYRTYNGLSAITLNVSSNALADFVAPSCNPGGQQCSGGSAGESATVDVDAVVLKVSYIPPGFEASNPVGGGADSPCAGNEIFCSKNNPVTEILGTVYAPTTNLAINVHNRNFTDFNRGIVAKSLSIDASASDKQPDQSPISLPGAATPGTRVVLFTAKISGKTRLRARVQFIDTDTTGATFYGYKVNILSWEVTRT
jgi:hypothetical protein